MWGEGHVAIGILTQRAVCGDEVSLMLLPAVALAVGSHLYLDDPNTIPIQIYHDRGTGWWRWIGYLISTGLITWMAWCLWHNPIFLICGLLAWIPWDIEWVLKPLGIRWETHDLFHAKWLQRERYGLAVTFAIVILLIMGVNYG